MIFFTNKQIKELQEENARLKKLAADWEADSRLNLKALNKALNDFDAFKKKKKKELIEFVNEDAVKHHKYMYEQQKEATDSAYKTVQAEIDRRNEVEKKLAIVYDTLDRIAGVKREEMK